MTVSFFRPTKPPFPRGYQRQALAATLHGIFRRKIRSQLLVLATGLGKTVIFSFLAGWYASKGKRVLILAHRDNLINQAREKAGFIGLSLATEKAGQRALPMVALGSKIVVGSVQTMRGKRLATWPVDTFDLVIIDEAHRAAADGYRAIIDHFAKASIVGVTATDRAKKGQLAKIFQRIAFQKPLAEGVKEGHLSPPIGVRGDVKVDLRGITMRGGDFDVGELDEAISQVIEPLALSTRKEIGTRKTIVFTPDIKTAQAFAKALCDLGIAAKATYGADPKQKDTLAEFRDGTIQVLCNCALLTEGYDEPAISCVVIARPTKSSTLMMQMVGRGTRQHPESGKQNCIILDFGWVVNGENVQTLVDLFAVDGANKEDVQRARKLVESGKVSDPLDALEQARKIREANEAKAAKLAEQKSKKKLKDREISYKRIEFDPFRVRGLLGIPAPQSKPGVVGMPVAPDTAVRLKELGIEGTANMSQKEANEMIRVIEQRRDCGMSSPKQIKFLISQGFAPELASNMTGSEAQSKIGPLMARFGKRSG